MITPMSKIELFVLKDDLPKTIDILYDLGLLHIEQIHLTKIMEQRGILRLSLSPEEEREKTTSEILIKEANELLQAIKYLAHSCLEEKLSEKEELVARPTQELTEIILKQIKPQFSSLNKGIANLEDELKILPQYKEIDAELFKQGTEKIELPAKYLIQPLNETLKYIEARLNQIPGEIEKLKLTLSEFAQKNISLICTIKALALNRLERILALSNFLQSKYTVVVTGWLPSRDLNYFTQTLEKSLGRRFAIYDRTTFVKHPQNIPVLLENPKFIKPYELLLRLLPPPMYGTKDATGLVSLFFPIFFGLIVGDIGYGLIFLVISLFLKKSAKFFSRSIGAILFAVSLSTIFFGFLYGEFFGNFGKEYLKLPHILFDRQESIIPFLILALSVGACHIVLGFLLGIIEAIHKKHKREGIEKIAILAGLAALFLLVATITKILPSRFLPVPIVLLVVVTILLVMVRGFLGPLEAISAVANILSYARIMALGLAGVMMATIANHIGGLSENMFIGIILASLLHALNLVLSVFSPTIQSLRLHYVEFFSKFYEPGGKKYSPFRRKEVGECIS